MLRKIYNRRLSKMKKIVLIGVGSASFGRGTIADILACREFNKIGVKLILVDIDETALNTMHKFSLLLKDYYQSKVQIEVQKDRIKALPGADYVITAVARSRMQLWEKDFYVPLAYGFPQIYGECGGPGAAFHTLRSFDLMLPICKDMERLCPQALLLNFTNPESRVVLAISKLTKISAVGLCHGAFGTRRKIAKLLGRKEEDIDITIGGINHFHWVLKMKDRKNGQDLYPLFRKRLAKTDRDIDKLAKQMFEVFGLLPFPADSHIGEYVSFAYASTGPFWISRDTAVEEEIIKEEKERYGVTLSPKEKIRLVAEGKKPLTEDIAYPSSELAIPIICDIELDRKRKELAVNIPNKGFAIPNLPEDGVVEIPALVDSKGLHPVKVGPLPEPIAAMCSLQISIQKLLVEAYQKKSKKALLQALAIDPLVNDLENARKMVEDMFRIQGDFLPPLE